jgi:hypothetical protein
MGDPLTSGWFWGRMEVFRGSGAVVAQLLPKQWVAGSNPVSRSNPNFSGFRASQKSIVLSPHASIFNGYGDSCFSLPVFPLLSRFCLASVSLLPSVAASPAVAGSTVAAQWQHSGSTVAAQ